MYQIWAFFLMQIDCQTTVFRDAQQHHCQDVSFRDWDRSGGWRSNCRSVSCQSKVLLLILSRVLLLLHKIHVPSFYSLAEFLIWGVELRIVARILGGHLLLLSITFRTGHLYFSAHITHMILLNKRCEKNPAASALSTILFYRFMSWIYLLFEERQLTRGYWNSVHQTHFLPPNLCVGECRVAPHDDQTRSLHRPCLAKKRVGVAPSNQKMSLVISSIMRDILSKISASAENYARFRHPTRWTRPWRHWFRFPCFTRGILCQVD